MDNIDTKSYTILYVEDSIQTRQNYVNYLKRFFKNIYEAGDGKLAYEIYKDKKPDILIIDINLPLMSGLEMLKKIRENDHTTKAIMLTAYSNTKYLLEASELKLTKYLVKPINRASLKDALTLAIEELSKYNTTSKKTIALKEDFRWDYDSQELIHKNQTIQLTAKERKILELFFNNLNISLSYDNIIMYVWDDYDKEHIDSVKTFIKKLRKKLPKDTITNVYGVGYKITT